ncbi:unnamed protein product [Gadus morhua 'NCC']
MGTGAGSCRWREAQEWCSSADAEGDCGDAVGGPCGGGQREVSRPTSSSSRKGHDRRADGCAVAMVQRPRV